MHSGIVEMLLKVRDWLLFIVVIITLPFTHPVDDSTWLTIMAEFSPISYLRSPETSIRWLWTILNTLNYYIKTIKSGQLCIHYCNHNLPVCSVFSGFWYLFLQIHSVMKSDVKNNDGMKCWLLSHEMAAGLIFSVIAIGRKIKEKNTYIFHPAILCTFQFGGFISLWWLWYGFGMGTMFQCKNTLKKPHTHARAHTHKQTQCLPIL